MTRKRSEEQLGAAAARLSAVLHKNRAAVRLLLATALLAWLLTKTSTSTLGNLPLALVLLVAARLLLAAQGPPGKDGRLGVRRRERDEAGEEPQRAVQFAALASTSSSVRSDRWREYVRSPVVEHAWETFCGSIVQQWIYDCWYGSISPDREFPAEVRRVLNGAFGQLGARARRVDLRAMLVDMSELLMEQIELFRDTRDSILAAHGPAALINMTPAARERAFRQEMRAERNLHPALQTPEGHYKFLRAVSEGAVTLLLDRSDLGRPALRVVCRELLAGAVLRPLMMWCTPYYANKALYSLLKEQVGRSREPPPTEEVASAMAAAKSEQMRGNFEFEQRARKSAAEEVSALLEARMARSRARPFRPSLLARLSPHGRSRSADALADRLRQQEQESGTEDLSASVPGLGTCHEAPGGQLRLQGQEESGGGLSGTLASLLSAASVSSGQGMLSSLTATLFPPAVSTEAAVTAVQAARLGAETLDTVMERRQAAAAVGATTLCATVAGLGAASEAGRSAASSAGSLAKQAQVQAADAAVELAAGTVTAAAAVGMTVVHAAARVADVSGDAVGALSALPHSLEGSAAAGPSSSGGGGGATGRVARHQSAPIPASTGARPAGRSSLGAAPGLQQQQPEAVFHDASEDMASFLLSSSPLSLPLPPQAMAPARSVPPLRLPPAASAAASSLVAQASQQEQQPAAHSPAASAGAASSAAGAAAPAVADSDLREWEHIYAPGGVATPSSATSAPGDQGALFSGHLLAAAADSTALGVSSSSIEAEQRLRPRFSGRPRAHVVAADLNTSGSKDYVVYKIRVADDADEWTVSRRFRSFETLHKQLRSLPTYRLKLPAKRIFTHSQSVEFVEERREQLDKFLQAALANDVIVASADLWEFLRPNSELYELQPPPGFFRSLATARSVTAGRRRKGSLPLLSAMPSSSAASMDQWPSLSLGSSQRHHSSSMPQGLDTLGGVASTPRRQQASSSECESPLQGPSAGSAASSSQGRRASAEGTLAGAAEGSGGATAPGGGSKAGQRWSRSPTKRQPAPEEAVTVASSGRSLTGRASSATAGLLGRAPKKGLRGGASTDKLAASRSQQELAAGGSKGSASQEAGSSSAAESPGRRGLFRRKGKGSPTKARHKGSQAAEASSAVPPQPPIPDPLGADLPRRSSLHETPSPPAGAGLANEPSAGLGPGAGGGYVGAEGLELEDGAGISAPLYEIVDCVFQLQTRGFFRRQVFSVARQALSLVAGDAIDVYLLSRLRLLRQEHTIARVIQSIQNSLWPGGMWFQYLPQYQQSPPPAAAATADSAAQAQRPWTMQADKFLEPGGPPPLDEEEIREAVYDLILSRAPTALVRLVGRNAYFSGMEDVFGMLQSPTFVQQLGYGLLHIALVNLFPELKPLFRRMERDGVQ